MILLTRLALLEDGLAEPRKELLQGALQGRQAGTPRAGTVSLGSSCQALPGGLMAAMSGGSKPQA
jgi:hypothetical protein